MGDYAFYGLFGILGLIIVVLTIFVIIGDQDIRKNIQCEMLHIKTQEEKSVEIIGCHRIDRDQNIWWIATDNVDRLIIENQATE